jgi:cyanophycinase-like exopeptidase
MQMMDFSTPGPVVLFGSGETSPSGRRIFDHALSAIMASDSPSARPQIALLETPAGFEPNSAQVIGKVADFLRVHLQNFEPQTTVIPARKRGTHFSPDDASITEPLLQADMIFMGPGSPTYALRQLDDSLAWHRVVASHRLGATLALASAATVAISAYSLPVYEIYKVGDELHWKKGLNLFGPYGVEAVFIPHWNNRDGGEDLDTSRCFMGKSRFQELVEMLPSHIPIIGIDEKTALVIDIEAGQFQVLGSGSLEVMSTPEEKSGEGKTYTTGKHYPLCEIGNFQIQEQWKDLPNDVWQEAQAARRQVRDENRTAPPTRISDLVSKRETARSQKDWRSADDLRAEIVKLGWQVKDTPGGPEIERSGE